MKLELHNESNLELDSDMLCKAFQVAARHAPQASEINIYTDARAQSGWLEWGVSIQYKGGGKLWIGVIQRTADSEFETHT